jgi:hypothetical protein
MLQKKPILKDRIRNIRDCTFGWVDHNFLHKGFLNRLSAEELLLYYFLITVADRNGVSFYDYERICQFLKLELHDYITARNRLCDYSLIAQKDDLFQVLSLPEPNKANPKATLAVNRSSEKDAQTLRQIFQQFAG